jgi:shikimate dehydrogenase
MSEAPHIRGTTRLYAILGDPIAQVRSPEVFSERFRNAGVDAVLVPIHVPAERFDVAVPGLLALGNLDGVLVTVPFKARMVPFAARLSETARVIGAVNALRREADGSWTGDMFDGKGFVHAAIAKGVRLQEASVLQFGAGGAGSAIACALAEAGVSSIDLVDPERSRAEALIEKLRRAFPHCRFSSAHSTEGPFDMVINASPVGMRATDGMPGEVGRLTSSTVVGDVVITQEATALVKRGLASGCVCVTGRDMHAGQVDAIMDFFGFNSRAPGATGGSTRSQ